MVSLPHTTSYTTSSSLPTYLTPFSIYIQPLRQQLHHDLHTSSTTTMYSSHLFCHPTICQLQPMTTITRQQPGCHKHHSSLLHRPNRLHLSVHHILHYHRLLPYHHIEHWERSRSQHLLQHFLLVSFHLLSLSITASTMIAMLNTVIVLVRVLMYSLMWMLVSMVMLVVEGMVELVSMVRRVKIDVIHLDCSFSSHYHIRVSVRIRVRVRSITTLC
mmetsp:Transcript_2631/g.2778  ORF Transcript_2631/g.2778 Transcript_2631/m.2778 type:complete len:216 (+) Transcript_2631:268-915(+)